MVATPHRRVPLTRKFHETTAADRQRLQNATPEAKASRRRGGSNHPCSLSHRGSGIPDATASGFYDSSVRRRHRIASGSRKASSKAQPAELGGSKHCSGRMVATPLRTVRLLRKLRGTTPADRQRLPNATPNAQQADRKGSYPTPQSPAAAKASRETSNGSPASPERYTKRPASRTRGSSKDRFSMLRQGW